VAEFFDFNTRLKTLPRLKGRQPDVTRVDPLINYPPTQVPWPGLDGRFTSTFAALETGYLKVDTPGRYRLALSSSDGAQLWLDGSLLVDNNGIHPMRTRARTLRLSAGLHPLRVVYFDRTGSAGLVLSWSGPGVAQQVIPAGNLVQSVFT
jgi:hypothetical protein